MANFEASRMEHKLRNGDEWACTRRCHGRQEILNIENLLILQPISYVIQNRFTTYV